MYYCEDCWNEIIQAIHGDDKDGYDECSKCGRYAISILDNTVTWKTCFKCYEFNTVEIAELLEVIYTNGLNKLEEIFT